MLFLYKISRENMDYDQYDSAVVCAKSPQAARKIHPDRNDGKGWGSEFTWVLPKFVKVQLVGVAHSSIKEGEVVVASFNAG